MGSCMSSSRPISADAISDSPTYKAQRPTASAPTKHASGSVQTKITNHEKHLSPTLLSYQSELRSQTNVRQKASIASTAAADTDSGYHSQHRGAASLASVGGSYFALPKRPNQSQPPLVQHISHGQHGSPKPAISPLTSPFLTIDATSAPPKNPSPMAPIVLASAFDGMDDIDVLDNPIEHALPPEPPRTAFGRRLARRTEWNHNLMASSPSTSHPLSLVRSADSGGGSQHAATPTSVRTPGSNPDSSLHHKR